MGICYFYFDVNQTKKKRTRSIHIINHPNEKQKQNKTKKNDVRENFFIFKKITHYCENNLRSAFPKLWSAEF